MGRNHTQDMGGNVLPENRLSFRTSDPLKLAAMVGSNRDGVSEAEYLRGLVERDLMARMLRTTGIFLGSINGLKQIVHDVRKKAGKE